jgi:DNA (cytosine-5)-methyltransferase 1
MFRIIQEVRPTFVLGENVANFVNLGIDRTISNLESEGYEVQTFNIPAVAVSAWHQRARIFVVGYAEHYGPSSSKESRSITKTGNDDKEGKDQTGQPSGTGGREDYESVADSASERLQGKFRSQSKGDGKRLANSSKAMADSFDERSQGGVCWGKNKERKSFKGHSGCSGSTHRQPEQEIWNTEPNVGRVAHGIPKRVDRLRALGNAVVPQQVYPILEAIAKIHKGEID